jgi:hypothetical protein
MAGLVPSYILKGNRAEKHLHHLKVKIGKWADTHPYEVRTTHYRKRDVQHLRFTSSPPPEIGTIAADFVYNIRSGLDHLMGALVPASERDSVYFPIYFVGVWEDPIPGEDAERTKARGRWKSDTAKVRPEAVAILKALQPPEDTSQTINTLRAINLIANKDRHQQLPVIFSALEGLRLIWKDKNGRPFIGPTDVGVPEVDRRVAKDGTELHFPKGAVDMHVAGGPVVAIEISPEAGSFQIPGIFDNALTMYRERAVIPLVPYIHRGRPR